MTQSASRESSATASFDPLEVIAFALTAPSPEPLDGRQIAERIRSLAAEASRQLPIAALAAETADIAAARTAFPDAAALAEAIYELRAFAADAPAAQDVSEMKAYVAAAAVPLAERELALDRAIAEGQVAHSVLVTEPARMPTARLAFEHFREVFTARYTAHHTAYWAESDALAQQLANTEPRAAALARLNTITELGTPVGEVAIEASRQLSADLARCQFEGDLPAALQLAPVCPSCALRLDALPPRDAVSEVTDRIDRSIERQMTRLSSVAVRAILERSEDPRVGRFLQIVQATQITTLADVLDDDLIGYLRRFLFEARINSLLEPILERVQHGPRANAGDTRDSLEQLAEVLHRAIRGASNVLEPPPDPES